MRPKKFVSSEKRAKPEAMKAGFSVPFSRDKNGLHQTGTKL